MEKKFVQRMTEGKYTMSKNKATRSEGVYFQSNINSWIVRVYKKRIGLTTISKHNTEDEALNCYNNYNK